MAKHQLTFQQVLSLLVYCIIDHVFPLHFLMHLLVYVAISIIPKYKCEQLYCL